MKTAVLAVAVVFACGLVPMLIVYLFDKDFNDTDP